MNRKRLRRLVLRSLRAEGFEYVDGKLVRPGSLDKGTVRAMHRPAVLHMIEAARVWVGPKENDLLRAFADGADVVPENVDPQLVEILPKSREELLFRYAKLHWSIPVSAGYGRRLRYLIRDRSNSKVIGLFGLADPVITLPGRDQWIGWDSRAKDRLLPHVMDAFVLGAVPPYSQLLGGKLTAMLVASSEVRKAFAKKYAGHTSTIRGREFDGRLALVTTTSALGRSAVYDRIRLEKRELFHSVGFTQGWGEFHFSDGVYADLVAYADRWCRPTHRHPRWGVDSFRNKREVVMKVLPKIGLRRDTLCHGVQREIFVVPLAKNSRQFLRGNRQRLHWFDPTAAELIAFFKRRWMMPRSQRDQAWRDWKADSWRLFPSEN